MMVQTLAPPSTNNLMGHFRPLLSYLADLPRDGYWQAWTISRINGGMNNVLYRVTGPDGDMAVKFTIRDERDRAGREYYTLLALRQAGFDLAPEPMLLDRNRFKQPVVVMSWLPGDVSARFIS